MKPLKKVRVAIIGVGTRGAWRTAKGFTIDDIDLSKLPGDFKNIKRDEKIDKVAREEGFI
jgi:hypothetical protein